MSESLNKLKSREDEWDAKILSNLLLMNRIYRPDEWTMDDFARMALELEERAEKAEQERDTLKAQLERAHKFIFDNYPDHFKAWSVKNV